ncbi:flagellar biosynthetic protein FliQ, partial [Aeromonas molluscorum]|uniref:flagellar biosynthetic protein FliQ n=1 Tax=Aeromonas molluscorum TaxID=271417 RepID=UPI00191C2623
MVNALPKVKLSTSGATHSPILPSLFVGLLVAIFQAATSINEQTLSFLPRLVVTLLALGAGAHWGLQSLMDFFQLMVSQIPRWWGESHRPGASIVTFSSQLILEWLAPCSG